MFTLFGSRSRSVPPVAPDAKAPGEAREVDPSEAVQNADERQGQGAAAPQWAVVADLTRAIAAGDLTEASALLADLPAEARPGFEALIETWNREMVGIMRGTSRAIEEGARPLLAADRLARETRLQSEAVSHIATVTEELAASIAQVSSNCQEAVSISNAVVDRTSRAMQSIAGALSVTQQSGEAVAKLQSRVGRLTESVAPIEQVLVLIQDVAEQTNLLALNAAIEAARAGEHGRGFAVVASEVRRLSERTSTAVREVRTQVLALRDDAQGVGDAVGDVGAIMSEGIELARQGEAGLQAIGPEIERVRGPVHEIAAAVEQQARAVSEAAEGAQQIAEIGGRLEGASQDLAGMVSDLQVTLRRLRELGGGMRLQLSDADLIELARADHLLWVQRLHGMLLGREQVAPGEVTDHTKCRLGRWYLGRGKELCGKNPAFAALDEPHRRLHAQARRAAVAWEAGRKEEARAAVQEVVQVSQEILGLLTRVAQECVAHTG